MQKVKLPSSGSKFKPKQEEKVARGKRGSGRELEISPDRTNKSKQI
jgi:hypothetical protein